MVHHPPCGKWVPEKDKGFAIAGEAFFDADSGTGESAIHTAVSENNIVSENDARHINILEKIRSANRLILLRAVIVNQASATHSV